MMKPGTVGPESDGWNTQCQSILNHRQILMRAILKSSRNGWTRSLPRFAGAIGRSTTGVQQYTQMMSFSQASHEISDSIT
jgi:hypothetical protein